ncbi:MULTISPECIES: hypothetical protein [unclassified Streptomyces]|uniref:hypothetical protein n=1 Tax=unclassified Streptomyces TaxID=2593676 RepID=UPI0033B6F329
MTETTSKYADFEGLRAQAVALRREGLSRRQIRDRLHVDNNDLLDRLLQGEPAPEWTKRPRAKDDVRAKARELRLQGMTYDQIQVELGCSRGRSRSGQERQEIKRSAQGEIGSLSERELFLLGVGLYWAEGTKDKPHARRERVAFVNSDPGMIQIFPTWLALMDVAPTRLRFHVMIHESADVGSAERYWADLTGTDVSTFGRTTLKKHNPRTNRKNVGEHYRGCLVIHVQQSADLYRRIEGSWCGIVGGSVSARGLSLPG